MANQKAGAVTRAADLSAPERLLGWVDTRFPLTATWKAHLSEYYAPKNFNFWYFFGSLALLVLVIQIVTGIFLVMHYKPDASLNAAGIPVAFASVEYIMREVPWGWLIRYMHSTGASMFFIVVYLHMWRGLIYGSYRKPRELIWIFGTAIFLCLMAEAFFGYLLPWGQMSFWGAQVIVNLFSAVPFIGPDLSLWIRGDYVVSDATLNRFFSFHVIAIPLVLLGLVAAHVVALHEVGSNNPDGVEIKNNKDERGIPLDGIPFHPYYSVHDVMGVSVFLAIFSVIVFFAPEVGGYFLESNNFLPANPLQTPQHIAPVWYFTPFYAMLRATTDVFTWVMIIAIAVAFVLWYVRAKPAMKWIVPVAIVAAVAMILLRTFDAKFWGVVIMGGAVVMLFFLPWLDRSPVKSIRYRPDWHKWLYALFIIAFVVLGYLGTLPPSDAKNIISQIGTVYYFAFFLAMPIWTPLGTFKPVPERVTFAPH
jgi:ubiquinol-cytochrome c reductase cytochrome b subunit